LTTPGINWWRTADLWVTLMRDVLGYSKFAAEGGDWGAFATEQLGHKYSQHLIGIYLTLAIPMDFFSGGGLKPTDYGPDEQAALARTREASGGATSPSAGHTRGPQTPTLGRHDSPVAPRGWVFEGRRGGRACGGGA